MKLGQTLRIKTENLTGVTLQKLVQIAREQRTDPLVRKTVENVLSGVSEKDWKGEIQAIFRFVKRTMRYTRDIDGVEYVKTPLRHLLDYQDYGMSYGDCDDMSLLLATLLSSAGYHTKFVIIRTPANPVNAYNHIYVEVQDPVSRLWIPLDATMKEKPFGWKPTALMRKDFII